MIGCCIFARLAFKLSSPNRLYFEQNDRKLFFLELYSFTIIIPSTEMFFLPVGMAMDQFDSHYSPQVSAIIPFPTEVAV